MSRRISDAVMAALEVTATRRPQSVSDLVDLLRSPPPPRTAPTRTNIDRLPHEEDESRARPGPPTAPTPAPLPSPSAPAPARPPEVPLRVPATPSPSCVVPAGPALPPGLRLHGTNAQGFREFLNEKDGTVLVEIPGGTFLMGSNEFDDEKPIHSVTLPAYLIARVPITNAQFTRFVSETGRDADAGSRWRDHAPVVFVNRHDATAYATWAGLRLPTEPEWEFATRGPDALVYPWGDEWDATRCRSSVGGDYGSAGSTVAVGSYPSGASPFGCLDMAGNVWEWVDAWYDRYAGSLHTDDDFGQGYRVLRGGSWCNLNPTLFRGAIRFRSSPGDRYIDAGARVARSL